MKTKKNKPTVMSQGELYFRIVQYQEAQICRLSDCLHIIPNYGKEHDLDSECWCQPDIAVQSGYLPVVLHLADQ